MDLLTLFQQLSLNDEFKIYLEHARILDQAADIMRATGGGTRNTHESSIKALTKHASTIRRNILHQNKIFEYLSRLLVLEPNKTGKLEVSYEEWPVDIRNRMPVEPIYYKIWHNPNQVGIPVGLYTDGSFHRDGGIGIVAVDANDQIVSMLSGHIDTCQGSMEAEYAGIYIGYRLLGSPDIKTIYHDVSSYTAQKASKAVGFEGICQKVTGHSGQWYNEIADRLASSRGGKKQKTPKTTPGQPIKKEVEIPRLKKRNRKRRLNQNRA